MYKQFFKSSAQLKAILPTQEVLIAKQFTFSGFHIEID
jgi:hypothetical protein